MSVVRGFGLNGKSIYENVAMPKVVNLNFIVDAANGNGLGIRSLKSNGYVQNVFMHTSTTPGSNNGYLNPNPAVGYALVQFKNNFNYYLGGYSGFVSPSTSSVKIDNGATLTIGNPYIIAILGNATAAQWTTVGVPNGITPAVGVAFIAIATGAGSGNTSTSRVTVPVATGSGVQVTDVIGDPNASIASTSVAQYGGAWVLLRFSAATNSSTTTLVATAPADNSVCAMTFKFDGSTVSIPDVAGGTGL